MRDPNRRIAARAYERLSALSRGWRGLAHERAALALGHYQYLQNHAAVARALFHEARQDPVLGGYALYWEGLAAGAAGQNADAVTLLERFRHEYPDSVMTEPALAALADAAIDENQPALALAALRAYPGATTAPRLIDRLAKAEEKSGDLAAAVRDYQRAYNQYPLNPGASDEGKELDRLRQTMGKDFPEAPLADRLSRAETLYQNGRWRDAREAYQQLLDGLIGPERDRAALRIAECDARTGRNADALETIALPEPQLDAERWVVLAGVYRGRNDEGRMLAAVEHAVQRDPNGPWGSQALFLAGNYYWANVKSDQAVEFYRRLVHHWTSGPDVVDADWRIAWTAYLKNSPNAAELLEQHVQRFPTSPEVPDALYWRGRLAEKDGDLPAARAYYSKVAARFVETYFGRLARERLRQIGEAPLAPGDIALLDVVRPIPAAATLDDDIPPGARGVYERAEALATIAFDDSAMAELRAAYRETGATTLLVAAARAAQAGDHYLTGAALVRQIVPDLESRPMDDVPLSLWRIVYPLPYAPLIRLNASRYHLDPMMLAALIRQESGFQADAVSSAGAVGLAQLEPRTARKWSRTLRLRYSLKRLVDPSYNLRVSGAYLEWLIDTLGSPEAALAAYNAGEDRVTAWKADSHFDDPAEFVESIPFSQTRNYVKVVLDGAALYRLLYQERP